MDRDVLFSQLKKIFEKNPDLSVQELIQIAGDAYHEVQLDTIPKYQPIHVDPVVKDNSEYESKIQSNNSDAVGDTDLRNLGGDQEIADSQGF